ncbi:T9SS type A sorting domain-containing protein [Flavobacterium sp.]|uniref:DUF7619 domain-containing protein n=1 Tax=Flavobacterium sp. TaxID=239 RepID=UPI00286B6A33|nr:T9SS type A sorting domain-containing protein [Flavobacterium sp.]
MKTTINIKKIAMKKLLFLLLLFTGIAYAQPPINTPTVLIGCDDNFDGIAVFPLESKISEILGSLNPQDYEVAFFISQLDANSNTSSIAFPNLFSSTSGPTIYCRVSEIANPTFYSTTSFPLLIETRLNTNFATANQTVCQGSSVTITLNTEPNSRILVYNNGQYLETVFSTNLNTSEIVINDIQNTSVISINFIEGVFNLGCNLLNSVEEITITVNPTPAIVQPSNMILFENPYDGIANFDLTTQTAIIENGQNDLTINYFTNNTDAINNSNPIVNTNSFSATNGQQIWVRIDKLSLICPKFISFNLIVQNSDYVYIPDNSFKTKLLSANSSNTIAKDTSGNYVTVDTNSNGEIEFSEALNISYLDVSQSNIVEITGISSFTNLTYLDCRLNLVLNNLDVSNLTSLTYLNAYYAGLSSLTLTPSIVNLDISANSLTGSLDLTSFTNLQTFKSGPYNGLTSLNLSGLTNLLSVDCSFSSLTTLNVAGCSQLQTLNCIANNISNLNVNGLTSLLTFDSTSNQIPNLDLSVATNLQSLNCRSNLISTLDVSSNTNLTLLDCSGNNLSTLDVTNCINIQSLYFYDNSISSIDLSENIALSTLEASYNTLTSLDLSNNSQLIEVYMTNNPLLTFVSLKNGSQETIVFFIQSPNIQFVCVDDNEIPFIEQQLDIALVQNVVVNSYCSFTPGGNYNTITGNITYDFNNNGCDANEIIQPNARVDINDGTMQGATFTDDFGNYTFFTQAGTFVITPSIDNSALFAITPVSSSITFSDNNNNTSVQNFCIIANGISPDVEIVIVPIDPARPGFNAKYDIVIRNKGNQTLSGDLNFSFDDAILDFISATELPALQNNGIITWNYLDLLPFESRNIMVILNVNSPMEIPTVNNGDILTFSATVNPIVGDIIPADNTIIFNQTVVGSFDPNDITCLEGDTVSPSQIGNFLHYVVNFENTGTFMAENVVVKIDIDPAELDIDSLQIQNTSHSSYVRIMDNTIEFVFENINLEAKSGNPPVGGHGNVLFKIRSNDQLITNDYVTNEARIYFDYNFPIETNIAQTTFAALNNTIAIFDESIVVYPNPTVSIINIKSNHSIKSVELYDIQGRILMTSLENSNETIIDVSNQQNGVYFLKITSDEGSKVERIMKK